MKKSTLLAIFFFVIGLTIPFNIIFLITENVITENINNYPVNKLTELIKLKKETEQPQLKSLPAPEKVKGIYLTGYTFSNDKSRDNLIKLIKTTELNSLVIDVKDGNGKLMFTPQNEKLKSIPISTHSLSNAKIIELLKDLQEKEIYTIARITTFQDSIAVQTFPGLALKNKSGNIWKNWQGISWLDMTNPNAWEIPVLEAKEVIKLGFDEIQFDYIRFPSDGNISTIQYHNLPPEKRKYEVLSDFYKYIQEELKEFNAPVSIDLFGLPYERRKNPPYDLNIGQKLSEASLYFDYISPMVYPSHYPKNYLGFENPAEHPYEIINRAMKEGDFILKNTTSSKALTRPWLQDFDIGAVYDAKKMQAQIKACDDNNTSGWLLWNPLNRYTVEAFRKSN